MIDRLISFSRFHAANHLFDRVLSKPDARAGEVLLQGFTHQRRDAAFLGASACLDLFVGLLREAKQGGGISRHRDIV